MKQLKFALTPEDSQEVLRLESERDSAAHNAASARRSGNTHVADAENQRAITATARIKEIYNGTLT